MAKEATRRGLVTRMVLALVAVVAASTMVASVARADFWDDWWGYYDDVPVYRVYNRWTGQHLWMTNYREYRDLVDKLWTDEGTAWYAPRTSSTPVYRLYNPYNHDHHYTADHFEYVNLQNGGWKGEGIQFYSDDDHTVPIYRLFNPYQLREGAHHLTTEASEYQVCTNGGWRGEDVRFYATRNGQLLVREEKGSVVDFAMRYEGKPYAFGAAGPDKFDCSGFTSFVFGHFGISLPHNAQQQVDRLKSQGFWTTNIDELLPGALVAFNNSRDPNGPVDHVGIYCGYDPVKGPHSMIDARNESTGVIFDRVYGLNDERFLGGANIIY